MRKRGQGQTHSHHTRHSQRHHREAQLTLFIIIGVMVVVVLGLGTFIYMSSSERGTASMPRTTAEVGSARQEVMMYTQSCLDDALRSGVRLVSTQGGYISPLGIGPYGDTGAQIIGMAEGSDMTFISGTAVPYGVLFTQNKIPSLNDMEGKLRRYILVEVGNCATFDEFEVRGWDIKRPVVDWKAIQFSSQNAVLDYSEKKPDVKVTIGPQAVTATLTYPVRVGFEGNTLMVDEFIGQTQSRLPLVHGTALKVADAVIKAQNEGRSTYSITADCAALASPDHLLNIFIQNNAVRIIDTEPSRRGALPLSFQFGVAGLSVQGRCDG